MSTEARARARLAREMDGIAARVEKLKVGYQDDPPIVQGLRGFVALAWGQIAAALPQAEAHMTVQEQSRDR